MSESLFKNRIILLSGTIDEDVSRTVIEQLLELEFINPDKDITILMNSHGGSVTEGFAILDIMNFVKPDIRTVGLGLCGSMCGFLLTCGTKGKRFAYPNTSIMLHQLHSANEGQASDLLIRAKHATRTKNRMAKIVAYNCNQPLDVVEEVMDRDSYFNAKQALEFGIVDKIIY